ncbi:hypothetical protein [Variovorax sp. Sphag1AA]|nr:hypothetical protein [Variovorax sp. Sphag1AA]MBB3181993.1 hypothetical protein [Variovorax sp. Sphag1AA]
MHIRRAPALGFAANAVHGAAATAMLDEPLRWTKTLQGLRA